MTGQSYNKKNIDLRLQVKSNGQHDIKTHTANMVKKPRGRPRKHVKPKLCGPDVMPAMESGSSSKFVPQEEITTKIRYCFNTKPVNWMYFWFISHILPEFSFQMWYSIVQLRHRKDLVDLLTSRMESLKLLAMRKFSEGSKDIDRSWETRRISHSHDQLACLFVESFSGITMDSWQKEISRLEKKLQERDRFGLTTSRPSMTVSMCEKIFLLAKKTGRQITPVMEWMIATLETLNYIHRGVDIGDVEVDKEDQANQNFFRENPLGPDQCLIKVIIGSIANTSNDFDKTTEKSLSKLICELMDKDLDRHKFEPFLQNEKAEFLSCLRSLSDPALIDYFKANEIAKMKHGNISCHDSAEIGYRNFVLYSCFKVSPKQPSTTGATKVSEEQDPMPVPETTLTPARKAWHDKWVQELSQLEICFVSGFPKDTNGDEMAHWKLLEDHIYSFFKKFKSNLVDFKPEQLKFVRLPPSCLKTRYVILKREGSLKTNKNPRLWDYGKTIRFFHDMGYDVRDLQHIFTKLQEGSFREKRDKKSSGAQKPAVSTPKRQIKTVTNSPPNVSNTKLDKGTPSCNKSQSLDESLERIKLVSGAKTFSNNIAHPLLTLQSLNQPPSLRGFGRKRLREDSVELDKSIEKDASSLDAVSANTLGSTASQRAQKEPETSAMDEATTVVGAATPKRIAIPITTEPRRFLPVQLVNEKFIAESSQITESQIPAKVSQSDDVFYTAPQTQKEATSRNPVEAVKSRSAQIYHRACSKVPSPYHASVRSALKSVTDFSTSQLLHENDQWASLLAERDELIHILSRKLIEDQKHIATLQGKLQQIHTESSPLSDDK